MTDIIEFNSKKYKKQSNGKCLEVSEYGSTQSEHLSLEKYFKRKAQEKRDVGGGYAAGHYQETGEWHKKQASKLSDKEYSEEELILRKSIEEIRKLNTKNLLRFYRAERNRMFNRGYRYMVIDEDESGDIVMGWDNTSNSETFNEDIDFLFLIKKELNTREHVS